MARPLIRRPPGSREFTNDVLSELAAARWSGRAWRRFLERCLIRSGEQALTHRQAVLELTLMHLAVGRGRVRLWPLVSWLLAVTHLGLLGQERRVMGAANLLTLLRANLPAMKLATSSSAVIAVLTDFLDGCLGRRWHEETAFGAFADPLADVVFWTWFVFRSEPSPWIRGATLAAGPLPGAAITVAYFLNGRSLDYPRPSVFRTLSAGFQCWLTLRAIARSQSGI